MTKSPKAKKDLSAIVLCCLVFWAAGLQAASFGERASDSATPNADGIAIVKPHLGTPTIFIDGKPFGGCILFHNDPGSNLAALYGQAGIHVYSFDVHFDNVLINHPAAGVYDREIKQILAGDPHAKVIPRIGLEYPRLPQFFSNSTTDDQGHVFGASFGSPQWERDETPLLRQIIRTFEKNYGSSVIGYQIGAGVCGEWCLKGSGSCLDFCPGAIAGWQAWLQTKYHNITNLQAAWRHDDVFKQVALPGSFFQILPPTRAQRHLDAGMGDVQDPTQTRFITDYYHFLSESTATRICDFARIVKQETRGKKLVIVFYGYFCYGALTAGMAQQDGFRAEQTVLNCPDIDALATPLAYDNRGINGFDATQAANDSTKIHGKCFVAEEDTEPMLEATQAATESFQVPYAEAAEAIKREIGFALVKGMYQWFFTQRFAGGNASSIGQHCGLLVNPLLRENRLLEDGVHSDRTSLSQIAVFVNQEAPLCLKSAAPFPMAKENIYPQLGELDKLGAPYDLYYLSDLSAINLAQYRLIVFLDCYGVNPDVRRAIAAQAKKEGKVLVWGWGSGIQDDTHAPGAACIQDLTGITVRVADAPNLLVNADFASLSGWVVSGDGRVTAQTGNPTLASGPSVLVTSRAASDGSWTGVCQDLRVVPGGTYRIQGWAKTANVRQTHLRAVWRGPHREVLATSSIMPGVDGDRDWFFACSQSSAPVGAVSCQVCCLGGGSQDGVNPGQSWFANLSVTELQAMEVRVTNPNSPFCVGVTNGFTFGNLAAKATFMAPNISVNDSQAEVLGVRNGSDETVFACKAFAGWTSLYVGAHVLPRALLKNAARVAGVNILDPADDTLYACKNWLVVSSARAGDRTLALPFEADVVDAWTGAVVGTHVRSFATSIQKGGETKIFRLDPVHQ